jgi:hypothetical protein
MTLPAFNINKKRENYLVYRIVISGSNEYCVNKNGEPCEASTKGWAEVLFDNCKMTHPDKKLKLIREKMYV